MSVGLKKSLRTVSIIDNEFYTVIDHPFATWTTKKGQDSEFQKCVNAAMAYVIGQIRGRMYYGPMFLTDEGMNIDGTTTLQPPSIYHHQKPGSVYYNPYSLPGKLF